MKKLLKFYSKTCGPCKVMSRNLEKLDNTKVEIHEIDIAEEENNELVDKYKVRVVPTIIILSDNEDILAEFKGITSIEKIKETIDGGQTTVD